MHQAAHGAHGKPDGKHQTEHHQLGAAVRGDKIQILRDDAQHIGRNELRQGMGDGRHIQVQRAKQRADKNQQRKDGEQQIVCQRRSVTGYIVGIVTAHHRRNELAESGVRMKMNRFHQELASCFV